MSGWRARDTNQRQTNPRLAKIVNDIRENPRRIILVIMAIVIGSAAVTATFAGRAILSREVAASFAKSRPAKAVLWMDEVDAGALEQARAHAGVDHADARRVVRLRAQVGPDDWRSLWLFGIHDFHDVRVSTFQRASGAWPPGPGEIVIETSALSVLGNPRSGDSLRLRTPDNGVIEVRVAGVVHDPGLAPGWMDNLGYAYASRATLEQLGVGGQLDELRIATTSSSRDDAAEVAAGLARQIGSGRVKRIEIPVAKHFHDDQMSAFLALLQIFSVLALVISAVLAVNVTVSLLARQTRQIGVMKTMGATSWQIAAMYLGLVLAIAAAAVAVGVPLGVLAARAFARLAGEQLNLSMTSVAVPARTIFVAVGLGLGVPLAAAAVPVRRAARMSARQAIRHTGLSAGLDGGLGAGLDGGVPARPGRDKREPRMRLRTLDRRLVLSLRNLFRRPVRLALTVAALAIGGTVLMTAANVYESLHQGMDSALTRRGDDIDIRLSHPVPADVLRQRASQVPGVRVAEAWGHARIAIARSRRGEHWIGTERYPLLSPPEPSRLLRVPLAHGRWPEPGEEDAVVINGALRDREQELEFDGTITLLAGERATTARVVGIAEEIGVPALYTSTRAFERITGTSGQAGALRITTDRGRAAWVTARLEHELIAAGWYPCFAMTRDTVAQAMADHFLILLLVLTAAALCAVCIGGLGLAATMGLNVMERSRELAIIRAMGATPAAVRRVLIIEGAAVVACSVIAAVVLSLPLSAAMSGMIGRVGLHVSLGLEISLVALAAWIGLALVITGAACMGPAWRSTRISVRDALAHDT